MAKENIIGLGSYVVDDYERLGRVYAVHHECPEDDIWLAGQMKPSPRYGRWFSILVNGGGSVAMHEDRVHPVEPFELAHLWGDFYFGHEEAA